MKNAAIVSGSAGWLGQALLRALVHGMPEVPSLATPDSRPIRALVLNEAGAEKVRQISDRIEVVIGDVTNKDSLAPLFAGAPGATVFHCAGIIHPRRVREFYAVNADGTRNMLELSQAAGAALFVHVSSNSPIGCNPDRNQLFDESSPYHPYMNYGKSKEQAEIAVREHAGPMGTVIIRVPWFYGPGQPARQREFFQMIKDGKVPLVGDGENLRSMAYVDNICQGLLLAERTPRARGQIYWVADRTPYTMNQIVSTIADVIERDFALPVKRTSRKLPNLASEIALGMDKLIQAVGLYQQKIHVLSELNKNIACSISKAETDLGYDPKISLHEGMRRSIESLAAEGNGLR